MKHLTILSSIMLASFCLQAQDYLISFTASGASQSIDSVKVENLSQQTELKLSGSEILHLVGTLDVSNLPISKEIISFFPNPMKETGRLVFYSSKECKANINIFNAIGKKILCYSKETHQGQNMFEISGLSSGAYVVEVETGDFIQSIVFISVNENYGYPNIDNISGTGNETNLYKTLKINKKLRKMQFNDGEILKITAYSNHFITVSTISPLSDLVVNSEFFECTDFDQNSYSVVKIGEQVWMAENLKTTRLNDGTTIQKISDNIEWGSCFAPLYCFYNNEEIYYGLVYGVLYNWFAVNTNKLCPHGWHVPTDAEWTNLTDFLGGEYNAGSKLKSSGTIFWNNPNTDGTNETGFTALPGGLRNCDGIFSNITNSGTWWSSTASSTNYAFYRDLSYNSSEVGRGSFFKKNGFSVRCLKD